jgi:uncharacterized membrane protein
VGAGGLCLLPRPVIEDRAMTFFEAVLVLAAFLCALTTGFVYTFAIVIMPGIGTLPDRDFLRAFQVMDRVIQQNDPRFLLVWVGSVLALIIACVLGFGTLDGVDRVLLLGTAGAYVLGVQVPTVVINVPMNNRLQSLDIDDLPPAELQAERAAFEGRWNYWSAFRTIIAGISTVILLLLSARL